MSCAPISLITVKYGKELFLFKEAVLEEFDITLLKTIEFDKVITYQEQLFEVVLKYTHLLTFDKPNEKINYASHKNNYALMIALISDLSLSSDWTDLLKQSQKYIVSFNTYDFDNFKEARNCCCRQHCLIKNLFLMTNSNTGLSVYTGCSCIEKIIFCGVNDDLKEVQKKLKQRLETTRLLNLSYVNTLKKYEDRNKKVEELFKKNILKQQEFDTLKNNLKEKVFRAFYVNRSINKCLKRKIIWQWKSIIQYKNNLRKKVIHFIRSIINDKVDFPKVVREIGKVCYFRFVKKHSKTLKWKKYVDYLLEESSISQVKKNKIIQFLK